MEEQTRVLEYKCPCCNAGLHFGSDAQKLTCEYCGNTFDIDTVRAFNESQKPQDAEEFQWEQKQTEQFSEDEESTLRAFQCPSCGGEILCDENTAASFCPYCENPTIMPTRLSGGLKPDGVIPFKTGKEDAKAAFLRLCKGKPFLPRGFTSEQRLEKITGMYVPFWLYDCAADFSGSYIRPEGAGEPFASQAYLHTYFAGRTVEKPAPTAPPQPRKKLPWWRRLWIWLKNN